MNMKPGLFLWLRNLGHCLILFIFLYLFFWRLLVHRPLNFKQIFFNADWILIRAMTSSLRRPEKNINKRVLPTLHINEVGTSPLLQFWVSIRFVVQYLRLCSIFIQLLLWHAGTFHRMCSLYYIQILRPVNFNFKLNLYCIFFSFRISWCNGYRHRIWTRRYEFYSWTRLIAFHIALIPLGKVWIQLFALQLWVNSRAD